MDISRLSKLYPHINIRQFVNGMNNPTHQRSHSAIALSRYSEPQPSAPEPKKSEQAKPVELVEPKAVASPPPPQKEESVQAKPIERDPKEKIELMANELAKRLAANAIKKLSEQPARKENTKKSEFKERKTRWKSPKRDELTEQPAEPVDKIKNGLRKHSFEERKDIFMNRLASKSVGQAEKEVDVITQTLESANHDKIKLLEQEKELRKKLKLINSAKFFVE